METGTVKWFNDTKGYGFIVPDSGGADVFVHRTGIYGGDRLATLTEGDHVRFNIVQGPKGPQAENVQEL